MIGIIPDEVKRILKRLKDNGYEAYIAGGAVRDMLIGKTPHDFDIATSATPTEIKALFNHTIDTGIKHGTVTVIENKIGYEVTTFRNDGAYRDGRHPENVRFVKDVSADIKRRDFTINAMMYSEDTGVIDLAGGKEDIENKLIRCVGNPQTRFYEDALRMLRAVRFSAVLSFDIEEKTARAIKSCAFLIRHVSNERILEELNKILLSDNPDHIRVLHKLGLLKYIMPQLARCFGERQKNKYHIYDVGEHIMHAVKYTPVDFTLRWAALMHDIGKPCCSSIDNAGIIHFYGHHRESKKIAVDVLHKLRMDSDSIKNIAILIENHDVRVEPTPQAVKRTMARTGEELFKKLMLLQKADNMAKNSIHYPEKLRKIEAAEEIYKTILAEDQPYLVSHLVINGNDLIKLGYRAGRDIGEVLKKLIDEVIINPKLNKREYLIKRAGELKAKHR